MSMANEAGGTPGPVPVRRRTARPWLLAVCALIGGAVGGTGGFALAAGPWGGGWHRGFNLERAQAMVLRALDGVGASTAQEAKVHDILATTFATVGQDGDDRRAAGKQMLDLLRAPTVDRAAVERLRADQVAILDARSKTIVAALLDAADQLTPAQRGQLADRVAAMMQHRREMMDRGGPPPRDGGPGETRPGEPDGGPGKG